MLNTYGFATGRLAMPFWFRVFFGSFRVRTTMARTFWAFGFQIIKTY
jgi:hypothetical protein